MKNKIITLSFITSTLLSANIFTNPLGTAFKATDNGGILPAIDAYKDGIGVIVLDNLSQGIQIDNSAMNTLVYKYGDAAKSSGSTIVDEVMYGTGSSNNKDKKLVGNLTIDGAACNDQNIATQGETWLDGTCQGGINTNGTPCNDGNTQTINDIYTNNICAGTDVEGQSCTDDNFLTIQDKYINGVCIGTLTANGQTCNDSNVMTVNDVYTNGICAGTLTVNGASCDDGHIMTINDKWLNGVCTGTLTVNGATCTHSDVKVINETWLNGVCVGTLTVNGQTCNDSNVMTVNDIYTNGVCAGTLTVNGESCNDSNVMTINDKYSNGVCAGTLTVNGQSCNDSNVMTINDIYTNGVCAGTLTINGTTCNDGNTLTFGDVYTNGVCAGFTNGISCNNIHILDSTLPSGTYKIDPDGNNGPIQEFPVYCDMITDGGGWTLVGFGKGGYSLNNSIWKTEDSVNIDSAPNMNITFKLSSTLINKIRSNGPGNYRLEAPGAGAKRYYKSHDYLHMRQVVVGSLSNVSYDSLQWTDPISRSGDYPTHRGGLSDSGFNAGGSISTTDFRTDISWQVYAPSSGRYTTGCSASQAICDLKIFVK